MFLIYLIHFFGSALLAFVTDTSAPNWQGYFLATMMFISAFLQVLVFQYHFHISLRVGLRVRSAIVALIYRESKRTLLLCGKTKK